MSQLSPYYSLITDLLSYSEKYTNSNNNTSDIKNNHENETIWDLSQSSQISASNNYVQSNKLEDETILDLSQSLQISASNNFIQSNKLACNNLKCNNLQSQYDKLFKMIENQHQQIELLFKLIHALDLKINELEKKNLGSQLLDVLVDFKHKVLSIQEEQLTLYRTKCQQK